MYICIQIDVTSTSHIATYPMNMRGFLSSIPPFVYQFTQIPLSPTATSAFSGSLREWNYWSFCCSHGPSGSKFPGSQRCCLVNKNSLMVGLFAKMVKNVKGWPWKNPIKKKQSVFKHPFLISKRFHGGFELFFHKSSVMCSRQSVVYRVETESSCWWKVQIQVNYCKSRWWFQIFFECSPLFAEDFTTWPYNIYQTGWFNHQPEVGFHPFPRINPSFSISLFFCLTYGAPFQTFSNRWPVMFLSHFEYTVLSVFLLVFSW